MSPNCTIKEHHKEQATTCATPCMGGGASYNPSKSRKAEGRGVTAMESIERAN